MTVVNPEGNVLVIGAGGGIGSALVSQLLNETSGKHAVPVAAVHAVSRSTEPSAIALSKGRQKLHWLQSEQNENEIQTLCTNWQKSGVEFSHVFICMGFLHDADHLPEKRIEQFDVELWQKTLHANTTLPMLWIKHLSPILRLATQCKLAVLSARVGSIQDNQLGGWYSYRASKSALNMMLKTASIEFARRAKGVKLIAFHPGTTDTKLSQPFQANVPPSKLFSPEFVARRFWDLVDASAFDSKLDYIDWDGKAIDW